MKEHSALCAIVVLTVVAAPWACGNSNGSGASPGADGGSPGGSSGGGNTGSSSGSNAGSSGGSNGGSSGGSNSGSSSGSSGGSSGSSSGASEAGEDGGSGDAGPAPYDFSVYQHHKNGTRDGVYIDPAFTQTAAATTHVTALAGLDSTSVYAQPLYVVNGPNGTPAFIVATEDNNVTAFNATSGAVLWNAGPSVIGPYATTHPHGGSIGSSPTTNTNFGITGTPYIDIASRTIFFDAMTTPDSNTTFVHKVFALNLDTGDVEPNWPVDVDSAVTATAGYTFNSAYFNQRGALQFLNGVLYVPYGGYNGDGTPYWGSVVGFNVASPQTPTWWHVTASKGGIWGPGALPTDGTSLFPVTGNTGGTTTWGGGEAVIRLAQGPTFSGATTDYFAPTNWVDLDTADNDLGGASEVLIDMPGAQYPHLVLAGGKDGNLYVLNRDNLGGIGGQLLIQKISGAQIKGAPAAYTTALGTYIALHIEGGTGGSCPTGSQGNLVVMKITQSPMAATTAWCSSETDLASPIVTTTDGTSNPIVWNADNTLYAWNGDTGAPIVKGTNTGMSTAITTWNTPIDAQGRIVVGVNGQLYVFTP
jgi:hypothetical protein